ncbi:hypothetical protein [Tabrizicola sp. BL-A-41-H6]|uniref:hypothetical protein n=1 Tax=Tabrizicola sp. BL-A-41-H6 TaxID=3421107 RepID=UPI003D671969
MSFVRQDVVDLAARWREAIIAAAVAVAGGWLVWLGGYLLVPLGGLLLVLGASWMVLAVRRLRFDQPGDAPGVVEVLEGQISYFGPTVGGSVGIPELVDIRLLTLRGRRVWRLKQADGQAILIPVEAAGAERLFDAFAALPGMDTAALVAAVRSERPGTGTALALDTEVRQVWRRSERGVVVR